MRMRVGGLILAALLSVSGCRRDRRAEEPRTDAGRKAVPLDALVDLTLGVVSALEEVEPLRLAHIVDAEASARLEAVRLLGWAFGGWPGPKGSLRTPTAEQAIAAAKALQSWTHRDARRRVLLLEKVARELLLSHPGPLRGCTPGRPDAHSIGDLLHWRTWPPPARGLAAELLAPYGAWARLEVRCVDAVFDLLFLYHRARGQWVLAELAPDTPAFRSWRYEPVPSPTPFTGRCGTAPDRLLTDVARWLQAGDVRALASVWDLRLGAIVSVVDEARAALDHQSEAARPLRKLLDAWEAMEPWAVRMAWRRLVGLADQLRGLQCRVVELGADERQDFIEALRSSVGQGAGAMVEKCAGSFGALRSARLRCGHLGLVATAAEVAPRAGDPPGRSHGACWRLVRLEVVSLRQVPRPEEFRPLHPAPGARAASTR